MAGVFGLRGELKVDASRIGAKALVPGLDAVALLRDGSERRLRVAAVRAHQGRALVRFEGIDDPAAAAPLADATLEIARTGAQLRPGEYFADDLIGCALVDGDGSVLGDVRGVEQYPGQDVLVVGERGALVPLVGAFVHEVDVRARRIRVDLPPGLLDERDAELG
ncbi:MAG: 16S rRNA processing protein RimM [Candidatus Eremiobacteraeota bacterium]|nr:16S rRNA processing protein RimM [Candidatus Eremiobacteraeota bacterium]